MSSRGFDGIALAPAASPLEVRPLVDTPEARTKAEVLQKVLDASGISQRAASEAIAKMAETLAVKMDAAFLGAMNQSLPFNAPKDLQGQDLLRWMNDLNARSRGQGSLPPTVQFSIEQARGLSDAPWFMGQAIRGGRLLGLRIVVEGAPGNWQLPEGEVGQLLGVNIIKSQRVPTDQFVMVLGSSPLTADFPPRPRPAQQVLELTTRRPRVRFEEPSDGE